MRLASRRNSHAPGSFLPALLLAPRRASVNTGEIMNRASDGLSVGCLGGTALQSRPRTYPAPSLLHQESDPTATCMLAPIFEIRFYTPGSSGISSAVAASSSNSPKNRPAQPGSNSSSAPIVFMASA